MLSFGEIIQQVSSNIGVPPTDAYSALPGGILPRLVQQAYQQIWDEEQWPQLVADDFIQTITGSSPNGESTVWTLPKNYGPILRAFNNSTGQPMKLVDRSSFSDRAYNLIPGAMLLEQYDSLTQLAPVPVSAQPAATGLVSVVTTATDTTTIVYVRGFDNNGNEVSEAITLNSATPVSSTNQYAEIHAFSKTKIPTGGLISLKDSSANVISTLSPNERQPLYRRYQMNGFGSIPVNLMLTCKKVFVPFQNLFDYAIIEMDMALIKKSEALAWMQKRQPTLAQLAAAEAEKALSVIREREINDENVVLMVPERARVSMPAREQIFQMDTPLVSYQNKTLHKGMNTRLHRRLLDDAEAQLLVNVDITSPGLRIRKKAPTNVGSNIATATSLGIRGIASYTPSQGTTKLVLAGNINPADTIVTWDGVTQSSIAFTGAGTIAATGMHRMVQANNVLYGTDLVHAPWKLNGTTLTTPTINDASGSQLLNVQDMLWFFNRMWYAVGDNIYFSDVGTPETITNAPLQFNLGGGDTIVRMLNYRDQYIVVFKASTGGSGSIQLLNVASNTAALFQQNITPFYDGLSLCSPAAAMRISSNSDADLLFNTREGYRSMAFTDLNSLLGPSLPLTDHIPDYSDFPFEGIRDLAHAVVFNDEILLFVPTGQALPSSTPTSFRVLGCSRRIPGNSPQEGWCLYDMMPATCACVATLTNDTQPYLYLAQFSPINFPNIRIQRAFQDTTGVHVYQEKGKGIDYGDPSNVKLPRVLHGSFGTTCTDQIVTTLVDDLGNSKTVPLLSTGIFTAAGTYEIERTLDFDSTPAPMPGNADVSVGFTSAAEVSILGYKLMSMVEENQPISENQAFTTPLAATGVTQTQLAATAYSG